VESPPLLKGSMDFNGFVKQMIFIQMAIISLFAALLMIHNAHAMIPNYSIEIAPGMSASYEDSPECVKCRQLYSNCMFDVLGQAEIGARQDLDPAKQVVLCRDMSTKCTTEYQCLNKE
jgi:hypothetical protein